MKRENFSDYVQHNCNKEKLENKDFKDLFIEIEEWFLDNKQYELEKGDAYSNIKKWIRLESTGIDADIVLKTPGDSLDILSELDWYEDKTNINYIYLDCIFSLKTHLNMFMRLYEPRGTNHLWLLENINYVFSDSQIEKFCENNVKDSNKIEDNKKIIKKCIEGIELLAKYTHTIGNYMPCPDKKYNEKKGYGMGYRYFNDRIEFVLEELSCRKHVDLINDDTAELWKRWFDVNKVKLLLNGLLNNQEENSLNFRKKLIKFPLHNKKFSIEELQQFAEYLDIVNEWINNRGKILIQKIINNR